MSLNDESPGVSRHDFYLSLVILIGGGTIIVLRPQLSTEVFGLLLAVVGYWFGKRNGKK